jgi:RimJ/RimL family protein N-acetyltransferase
MPLLEMPSLAGQAGPVIRVDEEIELRPLAEADVTQRYVDGINDSQVSKYLISALNGPQTIDDVQAMVVANWKAADAILFGIFCAGLHCGNVRLYDISAQCAFIGAAVFEPKAQGRRVGGRSISGVVGYATEVLNIREIVAGIDEGNIASQIAFSQVGFVKMGPSPDGKGSLWKYFRKPS